MGSNKFYSKDICENAIAKESERAYFAMQYNKKEIQLDVEIVASLILQYCYYRCLASESTTYDVFPMELPSLLKKPHFMTISVEINEHDMIVDSCLLYDVPYPWITSCHVSP